MPHLSDEKGVPMTNTDEQERTSVAIRVTPDIRHMVNIGASYAGRGKAEWLSDLIRPLLKERVAQLVAGHRFDEPAPTGTEG